MSENTNDSSNPVLTFEGKKYLINELSNEIKESIKVLQIAETQLKMLMRGLVDNGHQVGIVFFTDDINFKHREGIDFFKIPRGHKWRFWKLYKHIV